MGVPLDLKAAAPKCGGKNSERSFVDSQFQWDIGEGWFYDLCTDKASDTLTLALIQPDGKPGTTTTVNLPAGPGAGITCGLTSETPPTCVVQVPDPETGGHWVGSLFQLADTGWIDLNPHRYSSIVPMALYSVGVSDSAAGQLILAEGTRSPELANGGNVPEYYWVTEIFDGYADTAGCTVATRHGLPRLPQDTNLGSCDQGALTVLEDK